VLGSLLCFSLLLVNPFPRESFFPTLLTDANHVP
jgi:hypothetical protein